MSDFRQLNADLARVLGVGDTSKVSSVTLTLRGNSLPTVTVERIYLPGAAGEGLLDGVRTLVSEHQLVPSQPKAVSSS